MTSKLTTYPLDADKKMEIAFSCSFKDVPIIYLIIVKKLQQHEDNIQFYS